MTHHVVSWECKKKMHNQRAKNVKYYFFKHVSLLLENWTEGILDNGLQ